MGKTRFVSLRLKLFRFVKKLHKTSSCVTLPLHSSPLLVKRPLMLRTSRVSLGLLVSSPNQTRSILLLRNLQARTWKNSSPKDKLNYLPCLLVVAEELLQPPLLEELLLQPPLLKKRKKKLKNPTMIWDSDFLIRLISKQCYQSSTINFMHLINIMRGEFQIFNQSNK